MPSFFSYYVEKLK